MWKNNYTGTITLPDSSTVRIEDNKEIEMDQMIANAYFVFNHKEFSYPAVFSQSVIQKKSAGSWLLGASFTNCDFRHTREDLAAENGFKPLRFGMTRIALGAGYGHNFVVRNRLMFHISGIPSLVLFSREDLKIDDEKTDSGHKLFNFLIVGRGALIYNFSRCFVGFTAVYNTTKTQSKSTFDMDYTRWKMNNIFGVRL